MSEDLKALLFLCGVIFFCVCLIPIFGSDQDLPPDSID